MIFALYLGKNYKQEAVSSNYNRRKKLSVCHIQKIIA